MASARGPGGQPDVHADHDGELQCVVSECVGHSRRTGFGCAQSPGLTDYPDDLDVMAWLTETVQ